MRHAALAALLIAGAWAKPAAADDIDHPTQQRRVLRGTSRTSGALTEDVGFPAHTYLATRDGFARIDLDTENLVDRPGDNGGRAWRAYLRVITITDAEHRSDGWSTNGQPGGSRGARASLIVRVTAGESFTLVATVAQNVVQQQPTAAATYRLAVTELSP
jgi:hypothetical protein